ncbi:hypothetical protein [Arthrospiribacter ruber]|uniref:Uncharacterized protein n=1 Tax=Arthrospiribacter ruber TaxID=2487934 RepID=A0A951IY97_9BACT|nr:hypothetical protein [Arthrospiribacter ruber]MBW3468334.1 hypothetical protein [Arthrospiribacter ruber]
MKKLILPVAFLFLVTSNSCQERESPIEQPPTFEETESEWIRLAKWDVNSNFSLLSPLNQSVSTPDIRPFHAQSGNYLSSSGRYIVSIERNEGIVRFLDTGIENHQDHGHEYSVKWLNATAEAPLPTHFSATQGNIVIFNDGDGSVTLARESNMIAPGFSPSIIADFGNGVHHGAAAWLMGNKIAVTFKDETVPGALPQWVKLINTSGEVIAENPEVSVTGIHGDASNGNYAVFGATEGVIVAAANDDIKLIPNPDPLEPTSGNWMGTIRANDHIHKFYGYARNQGVFAIDPEAGAIEPVFLSNNIRSYMLSADGGHLIIQTNDNLVKVFDTATGNELASKTVTVADEVAGNQRQSFGEFEHYRQMSEENPVITASENFLYVLEPSRTKIHVRNLKDLSTVEVMELSGKVSNIMRVGFQVK